MVIGIPSVVVIENGTISGSNFTVFMQSLRIISMYTSIADGDAVVSLLTENTAIPFYRPKILQNI